MFLPGAIWRDTNGEPIQAHGGGVLYDDGIYYWYGENKSNGYSVVGVSCYSSRDLIHWQNEGVVLPAVPDDPSHDLHPSKVAERPKVLRCPQTGQYVLWLHVDNQKYDYARTGRAVSDSPTGPFRYIGSIAPGGHDSRDMTIFQDTDGAAYVVFSSDINRVIRIIRLTDDYLHTTDTAAEAFPGDSTNSGRESPALFRHKGLVYFVGSGCSGWNPNAAEYAVADSPLGAWEVHGNPCVGDDADKTFHSQNTFVLPVANRPESFIFLADRWTPDDIGDSRYVWLPIEWEGEQRDQMVVRWHDVWDLTVFDQAA